MRSENRGMFEHPKRQIGTAVSFCARPVGDFICLEQFSAGRAAFEKDGIQSGSGSVNRRCHTGRSGADDDEFRIFFHSVFPPALCPTAASAIRWSF